MNKEARSPRESILASYSMLAFLRVDSESIGGWDSKSLELEVMSEGMLSSRLGDGN